MPDDLILRVTRGPSKGRRLFADDGLVLGREVAGPGAFPDDQRMAPEHALIQSSADGLVFIRDLGGDGTFVNGDPVDAYEIRAGDLVQLGSTVFEVQSLRRDALEAPTAASASSQVAASSGGIAVSGNRATITANNQTYSWRVQAGTDLYWWARARGLARLFVIAGLVAGLAGFALFGYGIFRGAQDMERTQQAQATCQRQYPEPGSKQAACMVKAAQATNASREPITQWFIYGGGLLFAGMALTIIARFLPGADGPSEPRQGRGRRR